MGGSSEFGLTGAHLNVRSLIANFSEFKDTLKYHNFDLIGLTETWLNAELSSSVDIEGYSFVRNDRLTRGGGTGIYIRNNLSYRVVNFDLQLENTCILLESGGVKLLFCVIYKPPRIEGKTNVHLLENDLENLVMASLHLADNIIIVGDMNVNLLDPTLPDSSSYLDSLNAFGLHQLVKQPTRKNALLDHIISNNPKIFKCIDVIDCHHSDHDMPVFFHHC